jgi:carbonic anhydrase
VHDEQILAANAAYAEQYASVPPRPERGLIIVTCMDVRIDPLRLLGLERGDAHILRNAGGLATDDVIRSIEVSQRRWETREIIVIHHTDCAAYESADAPEVEVGAKDTMRAIAASTGVPYANRVTGYVLDIETGRLTPII